MYQIARRAGLDRARKQRGEVIGIEEFTDRLPASEAPGPEARAAHGQNLALLRRAMELLPADKLEILVLSRFQEMKYEDIATVLGCEVGTVKVRVYRAIRALEQIYVGLEKEKAS
jgi:RNA polymerase sigma-70 factor (ECF subfamily)